ncbi:MAG TPA: hypothetical protein DDW52_17360 [Planctomycetaceae bacterium]|nr:hypothetical protein [Planctomycetaceae bacterium]
MQPQQTPPPVTVNSNAPELASPPNDRRSTEYTDFLYSCMQRRLELAESLLELQRRQPSSATEENSDALIGVLSRKQSLLNSLARLQQTLTPYLEDDPESRVWSEPGQRAQCQELSAASQQILEEVLQADSQLLDAATARREAIAAELRDSRSAITTKNAYQGEGGTAGSRLDIGGV